MTILAYNKSTGAFLEIEGVELEYIPAHIQEFTGDYNPLGLADWTFWEAGNPFKYLARIDYLRKAV